MADMTLLEAAKYGTDVVEKGIYRIITERSPIFERLPFKTIKGNAYTYTREQALPSVGFRGVGDTWSRSVGSLERVTENIVIMGGEIFIDRFIEKTMGNVADIKANAWRQKSEALSIVFSETFFEGDSFTNAKQFDGLRARLSGNQVITAGANGAALTLAMLDQLGDALVGGAQVELYLNKTLRRKITTLAHTTHSGFSLIDTGTDVFGRQVKMYNGMPLRIVERNDNEDTYLGFDETQGGSAVTASIYAVRFGSEYVFGLKGEGSSMEVYDLGEMESAPGRLGRLEMYVGIGIKHPRAVGRLKGITNA